MTTFLDLLGVAALAGAGFLLAGPWLALVVVGVAALAASRKAAA